MLSALRSRPRQLSLFDETPFWDQASLEAAILRETGREICLTLTDNRSVLLSFRRRGGAVPTFQDSRDDR